MGVDPVDPPQAACEGSPAASLARRACLPLSGRADWHPPPTCAAARGRRHARGARLGGATPPAPKNGKHAYGPWQGRRRPRSARVRARPPARRGRGGPPWLGASETRSGSSHCPGAPHTTHAARGLSRAAARSRAQPARLSGMRRTGGWAGGLPGWAPPRLGAAQVTEAPHTRRTLRTGSRAQRRARAQPARPSGTRRRRWVWRGSRLWPAPVGASRRLGARVARRHCCAQLRARARVTRRPSRRARGRRWCVWRGRRLWHTTVGASPADSEPELRQGAPAARSVARARARAPSAPRAAPGGGGGGCGGGASPLAPLGASQSPPTRSQVARRACCASAARAPSLAGFIRIIDDLYFNVLEANSITASNSSVWAGSWMGA